MKRVLLFLIIAVTVSSTVSAQYLKGKKIPDSHSWIDYNLSYVKIKVYKEGLCRLTKAEIQAAGLSGIKGSDLKMVRYGKEVPLYVSNTGNFGGNDYLEFVANKHDGELDHHLYMDSTMIPNPRHSIYDDTAMYYLTVDPSGSHMRYTNSTLNLPVGTPTTDYVYRLVELYSDQPSSITQYPKYTNSAASDFTSAGNYYKFLSTALVFKINKSNQNFITTETFDLDNVKSGSPSYFNFTYNPLFNNSNTYDFSFKMVLNNQTVYDSVYPFTYSTVFSPKELLEIDYETVSDPFVNGSNSLKFSLSQAYTFPATKNQKAYSIPYLDMYVPLTTSGFTANVNEFYNPKTGVSETLRFDGLTANADYAVINTKTQTRTELTTDASGSLMYQVSPSSSMDKYVLYKIGTDNVTPVVETAKKFNNITSNTSTNYVMVTHPFYINNTVGNAGLTDYKNYRESVKGGGYKAEIVDITDIYENFGYGQTNHPLALKAYLNYLYKNNAVADSLHCFILCKGFVPAEAVGYDYTNSSLGYPIIPCYANPGSDALFGDFDFDAIPEVSIGRIPVKQPEEIGTYLNKIMAYENRMQHASGTTIDDFIMTKNVTHIVGIGSSPNEIAIQNQIKNEMALAKDWIEQPDFQGHVRSFVKESSQNIEQFDKDIEDTLLNIEGQSLISFYGHASNNNFDFNLSLPEQMSNTDKYFNILVYGCTAGNQYISNIGRSITEKYNFEPDAASVSFSGTSSNGWTNVLGKMYILFAQNLSSQSYGKTLGQITKNSLYDYVKPIISSMSARLHAEQWNINGDPAIRFNYSNEKDYAIESKYITTDPSIIDGSQSHITGNAKVFNIGTGYKDSVWIEITKVNQAGSEVELVGKNFWFDGITLDVPFDFYVDPLTEIGINKIIVKVDPYNKHTELTKLNNEAEITYRILSADIIPAFPYNFSIVNYDTLGLTAYTIDPLAEEMDYYFEIDTTEYFNSPQLKKATLKSKGGVVQWKPGINMQDSLVYYWRARPDSAQVSGEMRWKGSSFVYLPKSSTGWNQSHYFQYLKNSFSDLSIDSSRQFKFGKTTSNIQCNIANLGGPVYNYRYFDLFVNIGTDYSYVTSCYKQDNFHFAVIDSVTGEPWMNTIVDPSDAKDGGRFNSIKPCRGSEEPIFQFAINLTDERKQAMDFIDSIPDGNYILFYDGIRLRSQYGFIKNETFANDLMADTALYGSGNSLYHKLHEIGFDQIDSFYKNRPFAMFTQKGVPDFDTKQVFGEDSSVVITPTFDYTFYGDRGSMTSPVIGPAYTWSEVHWKGTDLESPLVTDSVNVAISGVDADEQVIPIKDWLPNDTSISFINAVQYPQAQLHMELIDDTARSANQNVYWRINYEEQPDLSIAPNIAFAEKDSVFQGEQIDLKVAVKNISKTDSKDSFDVVLTLTDGANNTSIMTNTYGPLKSGDTLTATFPVKTNAVSGTYRYNLIVNPDARVIESTYLNNSLYHSFFVGGDQLNPLLDVTFDNIHIIDNDIVSAKPNIMIEVRDDNEHLMLNDTSLFSMKLSKYAQGTKTDLGIDFSSELVTFEPATGSPNKAVINILPELEDGTYILDFNAKDKVGNDTKTAYSVKFRVINESSITSLLNYPNPFTSSTRFVFTLTGSEVPDNMMIQIFSMSGKLIKEIKYHELGPIHVGNNITEYAWDGTDTHGDPVGNGVYFYRMTAKLDGSDIKHRSTNVDNAFKDGIGKMYIVR